jgi:hemerythrin
MSATIKVFFPWKPEYSVHHPDIDRQHQRLALLVNDLHIAMAEGKGRLAVGRVLIELADYTKNHFSYEERQMERAGFPEVAQHKELHHKLLQQVGEYVKEWTEHQSVNVVEFSEFVKDWLLKHIGENDRPLAAYLTAQG